MNYVRILVDGYSLLHACRQRIPKMAPHSAMARDWLIGLLTRYQDTIHVPVTVFFDGMGSKASLENQEVYPHLEVLFSQGNKTADDLIERVTHKLLAYGPVLVVTNDRAEQNTIDALGGSTTDCEPFLLQMETEIRDFHSSQTAHWRDSRKS
ncbi:MAG: NYN domain-containing protein [Verrucomicrobiota bacterium]|nr:NYN domain-containing protein [Verrucomicrobiota bacterium]